MSKVSVIIPIYNVEQYLAKCLDSVCSQTYKDLEIICVNDCSPDNCAEILNKYAEQDDRIILVNRKENGGLSAARNSGLDVATGEYVYFIDSDDWIDLDYIEKMVETIEKNNTDIVLNTNIQSVINDEIKPFAWERYSKILPKGEFLETSDAVNFSHVMIWAHLYKKSFLDVYNLRFPEGVIHEDEYFQHISKIRCEKIFCFYGAAYYYRQRSQSIMAERKSKIIPVVGIFELLIDFYTKNRFFLLQYAIKFSLINTFSQIVTEDEFKITKKSVHDFFCSKLCFNFTDFEYFLLMLINESFSFEEFKQKIGKNVRIAYMRKALVSKPKVSVIIPCYNVEPYLRKCLNSVCGQTLRDIEIICVNDCSSDSSLEILKEYAQNDNRIKIINFEQNKGAAAARNTGIDTAAGEYIGFVDSDDWIDLDFYEKLYNEAVESCADVAVADMKLMHESVISEAFNYNKKVKVNKVYFNGWFCLGLYKTKIIKQHFDEIKFNENLTYGEDRIFPLGVCYYSDNVITVNDIFYYYCKHGESASEGYYNSKEKLINFFNSSKFILDYFNTLTYSIHEYFLFFDEYMEYVLKTCKLASMELKNIPVEIFNYFYENVKYPNDVNMVKYKKLYVELKNNNYFYLNNYYTELKNKKIFANLRKNVNKVKNIK